MVLVSLKGMNPGAAFLIMMGACAFVMPVDSARFLKDPAVALRPSLGLTLGGRPGVLLAVLMVKSLPLDGLRWLVAVVFLITAIGMLRSALNTSTGDAWRPGVGVRRHADGRLRQLDRELVAVAIEQHCLSRAGAIGDVQPELPRPGAWVPS